MKELTELETNRLIDCETLIEKSLHSFVEVGIALLEIRDSRLYQQNYNTFEEYCRARWSMSRPRAYQLIGAADIVNNLSTTVDIKPTHEKQVRPLAGLDPEQQREVWRMASEGNSKPTEKDVKAAVQKITGKNGTKPSSSKPPKEHEAAPDVISLHDKGLPRPEIAAQTGMSARMVREIIEEENIRRSVEPQITPDMLSMSAQQKLDKAIKQHREKLDRQFDAAVLAEGRKYLERVSPALLERERLADRIIRMRKGIMNRPTYKLILSCLHPDWVTDDKQKTRYENAFSEFTKLEKCLLSEQESPTDIPGMPTTAAEWQEAKRQATEARKARRQKSSLVRR